MIISRTPLRISFFGGGTDYPAYFRRHGGETLVTTIDKYLTVSVHEIAQFADHRIQVHYSKVESVPSVDEIDISVVRETLRYLQIDGGLEVHLMGQLPARTGLGSSSATTVGLLTALHAYLGHDQAGETVAREAVHIEQDLIGEPVGCQDQWSSALGGLRHLSFHQDGSVSHELVDLPLQRLNALDERLVMFYTGMQRNANEVLRGQVQETATGSLDSRLDEMRAHVQRGLEILRSDRDLGEFGDLLDEAWQIKRSLASNVSNATVDEAYAKARSAGARGGKLLGAGSGGFLLLYAEPDRHAALRDALGETAQVHFHLVSRGSQVIFRDE